MAYKTIIIDLEELKDIQTGLTFVHSEMSNIGDITDHINDLVGNPEPDLKGAISDFDGSWDDNRKKVVDAAGKMADGTKKVIDDWNKWDTDTAAKLTEGRDEATDTTGAK